MNELMTKTKVEIPKGYRRLRMGETVRKNDRLWVWWEHRWARLHYRAELLDRVGDWDDEEVIIRRRGGGKSHA